MASGSSGRPNSGSKGFDFASDDILCSYEDYGNRDSSNGSHGDAAIASASSAKDFHKSRMARSSVFPASAYSQPEDSFPEDVTVTVEKTMKKYADNLMRFLEGISSRLSQLELCCYNLDKSIIEMRSDLVRDQGQADSKLKYIEKHLQEVHRSVQILRDKQELAEAQKELAKLQLVQKESTSSSHSQSNEGRASPPASEPKKTENASEMQSQKLDLALTHQIAPQQQPVAPSSQALPQNLNQQQSYYMPPNQLPNTQAPAPMPAPAALPSQRTQGQYLPSDQYQTPQVQDVSRMAAQPIQSQVNQGPTLPSFGQYQQQWLPQLSQQVPPQQQSSMQPQMRPSSTAVYPQYPQPANSSPPEPLPNSMPMQIPYSGVPQPISSRADSGPFAYGTPRAAPPQTLQQQIKGPTFGAQPGDGYAAPGPHSSVPLGSGFMMYDNEGGRTHHPPQQPHFSQGAYPPPNVPIQNPQSSSSALMVRNPSHPQFVRSHHHYGDLIEKLVSMGFRGDQVSNVIQRMEETGQQVDFNAVLDRLNAHSSVPQRGW